MTNARLVIEALADPTRRSLVEALRGGSCSVGELAARTPVTRSAVSQHLQVLKAANLVHERREGTRRLYGLRPDGLRQLRLYVEGLWTDALACYVNEEEKP